jgi:hypothetical protein
MNGQRTITIGSLFRSTSTRGDARVPYVRMSGQWLEKAGFACGARLLIATEEGKLVITLAPPKQVERAAKVEPKRRGRKAPRPQRRLPHLAVAFLRRRAASFRSLAG